jgi:hypothetical protein
MISSSITRIVKVVNSDVDGKSSRRNSIAAWLAQQSARRRIESEQTHSGVGGGGERRVDRGGRERENSAT